MPRAGKFSFSHRSSSTRRSPSWSSCACITGAMMMVKIDTPWWERNPYWLSDEAWGVVYVLHGLSALLLITMVMTHIYFAASAGKGDVPAVHDPRLDHAAENTRRCTIPERWQVKK